MTAPDHRKGFFLALIGVTLLSTNFVTAKYGAVGFGGPTFSFIWVAGASTWTLIYLLLSGQGSDLLLPAPRMGHMVLLGVITGIGMVWTWTGLAMMDPSFNAFVWRIMPVMGIVMGVLCLKEHFDRRYLLPIVLMIAGGSAGVFGQWESMSTAMILSLAGAFSFTLQLLLGKIYAKDVNSNVLVFYRTFFAMLAIAVWLFGFHTPMWQAEPRVWLVTLLGSVMGPFLGFIFLFRSYRYWGLSHSSMLITFQPLIVLPLAVVFLKDYPTGRELAGGAVMMIGAVWLSVLQLKRG